MQSDWWILNFRQLTGHKYIEIRILKTCSWVRLCLRFRDVLIFQLSVPIFNLSWPLNRCIYVHYFEYEANIVAFDFTFQAITHTHKSMHTLASWKHCESIVWWIPPFLLMAVQLGCSLYLHFALGTDGMFVFLVSSYFRQLLAFVKAKLLLILCT